MTQFKLVLRTMTGGLPWEITFGQPSNEMAKAYAERVLAQPMNVPGFAMGADLWNMDRGGKPVASFVIRPTNIVTAQ